MKAGSPDKERMSNQPTPETDAMRVWFTQGGSNEPLFGQTDSGYVDADFARRLERERDEAREDKAKILEYFGAMELPKEVPISYAQLRKERDKYLALARDLEQTCSDLRDRITDMGRNEISPLMKERGELRDLIFHVHHAASIDGWGDGPEDDDFRKLLEAMSAILTKGAK